MIIFYEKDTGKIRGTIEGRIHGDAHLNQWVGGREKVNRIVVNWIKNDAGSYEPDIKDEDQHNIFIKLDKNPISVYDYSIGLVSGKLFKKY